MLGKLWFIGANEVHARLDDNINVATNLMNIHVVIEDNYQRKIYLTSSMGYEKNFMGGMKKISPMNNTRLVVN